jgi:hypothetical protein
MLITSPLVNLKNVKVISVSVKVMTVLPALQTTLVAVIVSIATVRCTCTKMCLWLPKAALISKTIAATMRITVVSSTEIRVIRIVLTLKDVTWINLKEVLRNILRKCLVVNGSGLSMAENSLCFKSIELVLVISMSLMLIKAKTNINPLTLTSATGTSSMDNLNSISLRKQHLN